MPCRNASYPADTPPSGELLCPQKIPRVSFAFTLTVAVDSLNIEL